MLDVVGIIVDKNWKKKAVAVNADAEPLKRHLGLHASQNDFDDSTFRLVKLFFFFFLILLVLSGFAFMVWVISNNVKSH